MDREIEEMREKAASLNAGVNVVKTQWALRVLFGMLDYLERLDSGGDDGTSEEAVSGESVATLNQLESDSDEAVDE